MIDVRNKLAFLAKPYILGILTVCYIVGELGHYLIGVTSKATAIDINYGDRACQLFNTSIDERSFELKCGHIKTPEE
jgi:hypothetical protein